MFTPDRYSTLLASVREMPRTSRNEPLTELELQAHWFAGDFGREFRTVTGDPVRIVQFGVWNREAGPDFADAAISFSGADPVRGCIELDPDARDWERHGHARNPEYEGVVLHVFTQAGTADFFTRTAEHRNVPQVRIDPAQLRTAVPNPLPEAKLGRCSGPLRDLAEAKLRSVLLDAARYRLLRKAKALAQLVEIHGTDEALYQALAIALGYKSNKLPFTLLAQRLPLRLLSRMKDDVEALLFGVSGFLREADLRIYDEPTRTYVRGLWDQWWAKRAAFERVAIAPGEWKCGAQRPVNHPQRRIAALAQIVRHWPKIRALRDQPDAAALHAFFAGLRNPYWDVHYTLTARPSAKRLALVGETRVTDMLANVFYPLAVADDPARWADYIRLRAPLSNRRVEVAATRLLGDAAIRQEMLRSVAIQQGLLQIYEDFCMHDASDCSRCRFPEQLTRW